MASLRLLTLQQCKLTELSSCVFHFQFELEERKKIAPQLCRDNYLRSERMATKRGLMSLLVLCQVVGGLLLCFVLLWLMKCSSSKQNSFHDYRYNLNNFISPAFVSLERPSTCFEIAHTTDEVLATLLTQIAICNIAPLTHKNKNKKLLVLQSQATQNSKSPISYTHRQPNSLLPHIPALMVFPSIKSGFQF